MHEPNLIPTIAYQIITTMKLKTYLTIVALIFIVLFTIVSLACGEIALGCFVFPLFITSWIAWGIACDEKITL